MRVVKYRFSDSLTLIYVHTFSARSSWTCVYYQRVIETLQAALYRGMCRTPAWCYWLCLGCSSSGSTNWNTQFYSFQAVELYCRNITKLFDPRTPRLLWHIKAVKSRTPRLLWHVKAVKSRTPRLLWHVKAVKSRTPLSLDSNFFSIIAQHRQLNHVIKHSDQSS
jgi:hypothetical protein